MLVKLLRYTPEPEKTCAIAARICYSSLSVEDLSEKINGKVIKDLLNKIISSGHLSVLEHASFTFGIEGVSRALLAQLTRHRIASFSVQSQRYVKFKEKLEFVVPPQIEKNKKLSDEFKKLIQTTKNFYDKMLQSEILPEDSRYILPQAATTKIILTMNARELRHFFSLRCCNRAQWEIREMACRMLSQARKTAPLLFKDSGPNCLKDKCQESPPCGTPWKKL